MDESEDLGPLDYLVVEFPIGAQNFTGEMGRELAALASTELIRVLDVLILQKNRDGSTEAFELEDRAPVGELTAVEEQIAEILAEEDVVHLAEAVSPGSVAGVIVWENTWAAPFVSAVRRAGGQLVAGGRIPMQAILASIEGRDNQPRSLKMPLRQARAARRGVIRAPVSRTVAAVGTTAVVAHGVNRRQDQRQDRRAR